MNAFSMFSGRKAAAAVARDPGLESLLTDFSVEVMPRTAAKVDDFRALLPAGTRVYVAHIAGTPIEDMVATAARLRGEGLIPMPHFPAQLIDSRATLDDWIARYQGEAGVDQALVLAGGVHAPAGDFATSMDLLETGAFDKAGFTRLHVAGHPEGNKDIDPDGSHRVADAALAWKQGFSEQTDAEMAIVTQFAFEAEPVIAWADRLRAQGITLPIHIGVAGPAKLQTLVKYAIACGVGPSLRVLQRRAGDVTKLLLPFEPTDFLTDLARHRAETPDFNVTHVHVFPLGGIGNATAWLQAHGGHATAPANPA